MIYAHSTNYSVRFVWLLWIYLIINLTLCVFPGGQLRCQCPWFESTHEAINPELIQLEFESMNLNILLRSATIELAKADHSTDDVSYSLVEDLGRRHFPAIHFTDIWFYLCAGFYLTGEMDNLFWFIINYQTSSGTSDFLEILTGIPCHSQTSEAWLMFYFKIKLFVLEPSRMLLNSDFVLFRHLDSIQPSFGQCRFWSHS